MTLIVGSWGQDWSPSASQWPSDLCVAVSLWLSSIGQCPSEVLLALQRGGTRGARGWAWVFFDASSPGSALTRGSLRLRHGESVCL